MKTCLRWLCISLTLCLFAPQSLRAEEGVISGDALRKQIDAAFTPEKTTPEMIALALQQPERDIVKKNIKGSAYARLTKRAAEGTDLPVMQASRAAFEQDFAVSEQAHDEWLTERIAALLLKLDPASAKSVDYSLAMLANISLNEFYPKWQKTREAQAAALLQNLRGHPVAAENIALKLAPLIEQRMRYAPGAIHAALAVLADYMPSLSEPVLDQLIAVRNKWLASIPDEATQRVQNESDKAQHRAHAVTIWDYATADEVRQTVTAFDRTLCRHPLLANGKRDYVTIAHGNGINQSGAATFFACSGK